MIIITGLDWTDLQVLRKAAAILITLGNPYLSCAVADVATWAERLVDRPAGAAPLNDQRKPNP